MKTSEVQKIQEDKAIWLSAHSKQQTNAAFLCLLTWFVIFVLPQFIPAPYSLIVMLVGGAASFHASLYLFPQSYCTRTGSLTPVHCLLAFLWLIAFVGTFFASIGKIS